MTDELRTKIMEAVGHAVREAQKSPENTEAIIEQWGQGVWRLVVTVAAIQYARGLASEPSAIKIDKDELMFDTEGR